jgi:hypothetical protein
VRVWPTQAFWGTAVVGNEQQKNSAAAAKAHAHHNIIT